MEVHHRGIAVVVRHFYPRSQRFSLPWRFRRCVWLQFSTLVYAVLFTAFLLVLLLFRIVIVTLFFVFVFFPPRHDLQFQTPDSRPEPPSHPSPSHDRGKRSPSHSQQTRERKWRKRDMCHRGENRAFESRAEGHERGIRGAVCWIPNADAQICYVRKTRKKRVDGVGHEHAANTSMVETIFKGGLRSKLLHTRRRYVKPHDAT